MTTNILAVARELKEMGLSADQITAILIANASGNDTSASTKTSSKKKSAPKDAPKTEIPFTRHDGKVVMAKSQAQWDAWKRSQDGYEQRRANFDSHGDRMKDYVPSDALKEAIRKDRCAITFKVAKEQYGFVGTKESLKALKNEILA